MNPCLDLTGNITQYQISFQTGSVVSTENVNIARCTAGSCSHSFEPPSNTPSSYDSVSVAAENMVGVGAAETCTTQTISELLACINVFFLRLNITMKSSVHTNLGQPSTTGSGIEFSWICIVFIFSTQGD